MQQSTEQNFKSELCKCSHAEGQADYVFIASTHSKLAVDEYSNLIKSWLLRDLVVSLASPCGRCDNVNHFIFNRSFPYVSRWAKFNATKIESAPSIMYCKPVSDMNSKMQPFQVF